jgi:polar amino acid transport system ATP-binding protein
MVNALEIQDIKKSFGTNCVLKNVSLMAKRGEVISIIGPSGSGKSTLLRCINGLEVFEEGRVAIGELQLIGSASSGRTAHREREQALLKIRREVGMVFQGFNLFEHLTAMENIVLAPRTVLKEEEADAKKNADRLLLSVGLSDKGDSYPAQLSGGQQQRIAIARALAMRPRVLLLDEITSALDPELVGEVLSVVQALAAEGQTMLMVTHEMDFAREVSDRIVFMDQGTIVEMGSPSEVLDSPQSERTQRFLKRVINRQPIPDSNSEASP